MGKTAAVAFGGGLHSGLTAVKKATTTGARTYWVRAEGGTKPPLVKRFATPVAEHEAKARAWRNQAAMHQRHLDDERDELFTPARATVRAAQAHAEAAAAMYEARVSLRRAAARSTEVILPAQRALSAARAAHSRAAAALKAEEQRWAAAQPEGARGVLAKLDRAKVARAHAVAAYARTAREGGDVAAAHEKLAQAHDTVLTTRSAITAAGERRAQAARESAGRAAATRRSNAAEALAYHMPERMRPEAMEAARVPTFVARQAHSSTPIAERVSFDAIAHGVTPGATVQEQAAARASVRGIIAHAGIGPTRAFTSAFAYEHAEYGGSTADVVGWAAPNGAVGLVTSSQQGAKAAKACKDRDVEAPEMSVLVHEEIHHAGCAFRYVEPHERHLEELVTETATRHVMRMLGRRTEQGGYDAAVRHARDTVWQAVQDHSPLAASRLTAERAVAEAAIALKRFERAGAEGNAFEERSRQFAQGIVKAYHRRVPLGADVQVKVRKSIEEYLAQATTGG